MTLWRGVVSSNEVWPLTLTHSRTNDDYLELVKQLTYQMVSLVLTGLMWS